MPRLLPLAALALVLLLAATACETDEADEATDVADDEPTAEPEPGPEPPEDADAEPDAEADEDAVADVVATIAGQLEDLRGLEVREEISTSVVDQAELADIAVDDERDAEDEEAREASRDLLVALRFLPPDVDLDEVTEELVEGGVAGLYDPEEGEAYISSEEWPLGPAAQVTTAHEIVHALQDQAFDLTRLSELDEESPDAAMAFRSIVEGDAVRTQEQWASQHLTEEERAARAEEEQAAAMEAQQALAGLPPYVVFEQLIPYELGERFLRETLDAEGGDAGAAVDALLEDPPATTVELYDPALHRNGFEPEDVEPPASPGDGWDPLDRFGFGAYLVNAYFFLGESLAEGAAATSLWRGGELEAWRGPDGVAVGATVRFADDGADRFCAVVPSLHTGDAGAEEVADGRYETDRDALAVDCDANEVRFATAPTLDDAEVMLGG